MCGGALGCILGLKRKARTFLQEKLVDDHLSLSDMSCSSMISDPQSRGKARRALVLFAIVVANVVVAVHGKAVPASVGGEFFFKMFVHFACYLLVVMLLLLLYWLLLLCCCCCCCRRCYVAILMPSVCCCCCCLVAAVVVAAVLVAVAIVAVIAKIVVAFFTVAIVVAVVAATANSAKHI